jgi:hypothetical protein
VLVGQASVQHVPTITSLLGNVSSKDVCRSDGGLDTARYPVSHSGNAMGMESTGCDGGCDGLSIAVSGVKRTVILITLSRTTNCTHDGSTQLGF